MLIGIISDTHGAGAVASAAVALLSARGAQFLIHCGDVGSESVLDALSGTPSAFVWGNTDIDRAELERYAAELQIQCLGTFGELDLSGKRFAITHGDDQRLVRKILDEQQHDYLLVGHTHVPADQQIGRTRLINPGALHRAKRKTAVLLATDKDQLEFLVVEL